MLNPLIRTLNMSYDEFEDNNPFAEPIPVTISSRERDSVDERSSIINTQSSLAIYEPQPDPNYPQQAKPQPSPSDLDLRKLLPERYSNKYLITIKLIAIEKNKPGNPILKFNATVENLPRFRQSTYKEIRRTFQETTKFNKYLLISNLECFVPPIPNCETSYPTGGEDETKQCLINWQEWFDRITNNPIIIRDDEFVYFIENDFGYSVINTNRKQSVASGLIRKTLKQFKSPYDEYEDLANFRPIIKHYYLTFQKVEKLLEKTNTLEKGLVTNVGELSQKLLALSKVEIIHPGMKNMWEKLARIKSIEAELILVQLYNDMGTLGDGINNLIQEFYEIKEALTNRYLIMRELDQAQQNTRAKHVQANKIKSKSSLDPIKVDEAIRSLEHANKVEDSLQLQVKRISGEMLVERKEMINYTDLKLHKLLKNLSLTKIEHHRKILKHLETIRLDIRIIDERGGLSRLNRENLTDLKHNLTQSQTNNGDAWSSRTFRSLKEKVAKQENTIDDNDSGNLEIDAKNAANLLGVATF